MITVVASRKGGSGKSTISCNMAAILAGAGKKVALIDKDPQGTSMNWSNSRGELEELASVPTFPVTSGKSMLKTIKDLDKTFEHVIVDLQGVDSEDNRFVLTIAHRVILPFKPSQPDLDTIPWVSDMVGQLREVNPDVQIFYVINEAPTTTAREKNEAIEYFKNFELTPIPTIIHARKAYRDSMATGKGAVELSDLKASEEIKAVYSDLFC